MPASKGCCCKIHEGRDCLPSTSSWRGAWHELITLQVLVYCSFLVEWDS